VELLELLAAPDRTQARLELEMPAEAEVADQLEMAVPGATDTSVAAEAAVAQQ
jgi:hypothetical protein